MNKRTLHRGVAGTGVAGLLISLLVASGGTLSFVAGCGGSGGGTGAGGGTGGTTTTGLGGGDGGPLTTATRAAAATEAATKNALCTSLPTRFYWEIGDASTTLVSGQGGDAGASDVDPTKPMVLASASKWIFGAYALEARSYDAIVAAGDDVYLNFTSGYHSLDNLLCVPPLAPTVGDCFTAGNNDHQTLVDKGTFFYNGGHLQAYAVNVAMLGGDYRSMLAQQMMPALAADVQAKVGNLGLTYSSPLPAGGGLAPPSQYAAFLRRVLGGSLQIGQHLGDRQVCAWTHHSDCPALYSPVNESVPGVATNDVSDEKWHYGLAHWVEEDGTFSSPGADGFYPWIDASRKYYGILARYDPGKAAGVDAGGSGEDSGPAYFRSVECGRAIRNAWLTGHQ